jgi:DNA repair protein RecN (Recombination protein N)
LVPPLVTDNENESTVELTSEGANMLVELRIQDFAIIENLTVKLTKGFNVITGETGAGKSILIDAVDFALGGRAETAFIRGGAERANVELVFNVPNELRTEIRTLLENNEIQVDSFDPLILGREVRENGRSAAKVNGVSCKVPLFREIAGLLVDIHGQTDHLSLLKPKNHLFLLDRFADMEEPREALSELVRKLKAIRQTMDSLRRSDREREQRIEMLKYQLEEIESARLQDDEEQALREERTRLANSEKLAELCEEAYSALYGEDEFGPSGITSINRAVSAITKLAALDESLEEQEAIAENLSAQLEELADAVRHYRDHLEVSPKRLNLVEERLEIISRLKRKYGDSLKAVLERAERAREELQDIEMGEERLAELQKDEDSLLRSIGDLAKNLSKGRRRHGKTLAGMIEAQLKDLRMEGARFEVSSTQEEDPEGCYVEDDRLAFDATGIDRVEFLLSANPGEPLRPLAQVASGGETARIMLALKTVLSRADRTPTLIFDEIDQGIGGRLGMVVGEKLWELSSNHQVMCVTHLAQIAGFADIHFNVAKGQDGKRTTTQVHQLNVDTRVKEMAEMLGGASSSSLQNAQELFDSAVQIKKGQKALF